MLASNCCCVKNDKYQVCKEANAMVLALIPWSHLATDLQQNALSSGQSPHTSIAISAIPPSSVVTFVTFSNPSTPLLSIWDDKHPVLHLSLFLGAAFGSKIYLTRLPLPCKICAQISTLSTSYLVLSWSFNTDLLVRFGLWCCKLHNCGYIVMKLWVKVSYWHFSVKIFMQLKILSIELKNGLFMRPPSSLTQIIPGASDHFLRLHPICS